MITTRKLALRTAGIGLWGEDPVHTAYALAAMTSSSPAGIITGSVISTPSLARPVVRLNVLLGQRSPLILGITQLLPAYELPLTQQRLPRPRM